MKRMLPLLLVLALSAHAVAQDDVEPAKLDNGTADSAVDDVLDAIGDAADSVGDAVQSAGEGIGDGVTAVGKGIGKLFAAIGDGLAATFTGLTSASAVVALGIGGAALAIGDALGTTIAFTGEGLTAAFVATAQGIGLAFSAVGTGLAFVAGAYWDLIATLRPSDMPVAAFVGTAAVGGAATTGVGGWAGWNVLRKWGMVGGGLAAPIAGFSRINDAELLDHPVRAQIMGTIQSHPGIHASQLAREVGVGWGTVSHHLDKLSRANLVTTRKVNNQKCFFEQGGAVSRQDMEAASAVKGDTAGRVAGFVHAHPMTSQKELAESLGISAALASFHVKKLVNLGVLDKMRHGKETLLTTSASMRRLLEADRNLLAAMDARADEALQYSA